MNPLLRLVMHLKRYRNEGAECIFQGSSVQDDCYCSSLRYRSDGVLLRNSRVSDGLQGEDQEPVLIPAKKD